MYNLSIANMKTNVQFVDEPALHFVDRRSQVWLECNGDPVELRLVAVVATRESIRGIELVKSARAATELTKRSGSADLTRPRLCSKRCAKGMRPC